MKNITYFIVALVLFASCEDVIVLDLENDEPQLVIEAVVDATAKTVTVQLTKSNGFYDGVDLNTVDDATITLTLADGNTVNIPTASNGQYFVQNLPDVEPNQTLSLEVISEGQVYNASTVAPHPVTIDSLSFEAVDFGPGAGGPFGGNDDEPTSYRVFTFWQDLPDIENFYRIRAAQNDTVKVNVYTMVDDIGNNGKQIFRPFFDTFEGESLVDIELLALDKGSFTYFSDLSNIQGQGLSSPTPFNPRTNFNNGALGYFGIIFNDKAQVLLPE